VGSGYLLNRLPFPAGYQVVFAIGFLGAAMSSLHLYLIKTPAASEEAARVNHKDTKDTKEHEELLGNGQDNHEDTKGRSSFFTAIRADVLTGPFRFVLLALLLFHLTQWLPLPIFPLFQVNVLHLTDNQLGIGSGIFYFILLIGSTQLRNMVQRVGHRKVTAIGLMSMALYPIGLALSSNSLGFYITSAIGGLASSLATGGYVNYLLEHIPANDRPAYLAWYNVVLNICVLAGSLFGPVVANAIGLTAALYVFAAARALAGVAIFRWGSPEAEVQA
jgi:MFS family permease